MRGWLVLLLVWVGLAAAAPACAAPIETRSLSICRQVEGRMTCRPVTDGPLSLAGPEVYLVTEVDIAPEAVRADRPLMVVLMAMAASEVSWNGVVIGRNGVPGRDAAHEVPGRMDATFVVPDALVHPGRTVVVARMSSHHLALPVRNPVHAFMVAPLADPMRWGIMRYLPALLMIGVLGIAAVWFGVAAALDRSQPGAALLSAIAGAAVVQLAVETARAFIAYPYPWHLARVAAIAGLSALTAVLVTAWAARRFSPRLRWIAPGAVLAFGAGVLALTQSYDEKASFAVLAGFVGLAVCAADGVRRRAARARLALGLALAAVALEVWQGPAFLDSGYYLGMAAVFAMLVAGQVLALARSRTQERVAEGRAETLQEALDRRDQAMATIRDGARVHRVPTADILWLQAADDYCEAHLADGRKLLSTLTLAQTLETLPGDFVRIHKSHAVNADHVVTIGPRPGGRRAVTLTDGTVAPVGRTYEPALARLATGGVAVGADQARLAGAEQKEPTS